MSEIKTGMAFPKLWDDSSLRAYLGEISRRHGIIETLALPSMRDLPPLRIETLFVQPLLADKQVSADSDPKSWPEGKSLLETLTAHPQLVVLGDPGSGKTTLSNWLAWRLSAGLTAPLPPILENRVPLPCVLREMPSEVFKPGSTLAGLAASIAERLLGDKADDALKASLRARVEAGSYVLILDGVDEIPVLHRKTVAEWVRQAQSQNACMLATSRIVGYEDFPIDRLSIDVPSTAEMEKWIAQSEFIKHARSLIRPRDETYAPIAANLEPESLLAIAKAKIRWLTDDALLPTAMNLMQTLGEMSSAPITWAQRCYLMPFDQVRIAAFVENWYRQRCGSEQEARQKAGDLLAALAQSDVTRQLARTPNLLGLMAIVHRERAHLPDGKALLYDEIANAYINTIDKQRKIMPGDALAPYEWKARRAWLAYIGFRMQQLRSKQQEKDSEKTEDGVLASEEAVRSWLAEAMQLDGVEQPAATAKLFLNWVARRSGLLLPRGEGRYAFVHLSFQEYFCARYLDARIASRAFIHDKLGEGDPVTRPKLAAWSKLSVWRETLIYLFELQSAERGADWVDDLTEVLFPLEKDNPNFGEDQAALAGRLLTDRHIRLGETWKDQLADRCLLQAWNELQLRKFGAEEIVLPALLEAGYAAIVGEPPNASAEITEPAKPTLQYTNLQDIAIHHKLRLCIVKDKNISDITPLAGLNNLQWLDLNGTQVADVAPLAGLNSLQQLKLNGTRVADITPLAGLNSLQWLDLDGTQVANVAPLAGFNSLQRLDLVGTRVADVAPLAGLTNLRALDLGYTQVEDIAPLAGLNNLQWLDLNGTQVADVAPLAGLNSLQWLDLNGTQVADIAPLAGLNNLQWLILDGTEVADVTLLAGLKHLEIIGAPSSRKSPAKPKGRAK